MIATKIFGILNYGTILLGINEAIIELNSSYEFLCTEQTDPLLLQIGNQTYKCRIDNANQIKHGQGDLPVKPSRQAQIGL